MGKRGAIVNGTHVLAFLAGAFVVALASLVSSFALNARTKFPKPDKKGGES